MPDWILNCTNCGRTTIADIDRPFPRAHVGSIGVICPFCDQEFFVGFTNRTSVKVDTRYEHDRRAKSQLERGEIRVHEPESSDSNTAEDTTTASSQSPAAESSGGSWGRSSRARSGATSPNDQRSNTLNPNNSAARAAASNRSNQMNPNNPVHRSYRGRSRER